MSERKVLNKYYPPDFDPSKLPRMKLSKNRQYTVRLMAPFNMRCKTCGEYIYKGKKFNARKEDVDGDDYLGIRIYRFYIKCTRCLQEISFKTDPQNTDYEIEAGATRNFMALKLAEQQAQREDDELKEEEASNPMKLLEKRTQQSKQELESLESLEDLKDLNKRQQTIDYDKMLGQYDTKSAKEKTIKEQEEIDEEYIKSIFNNNKRKGTVVEEIIEFIEDDTWPPKKLIKTNNATSVHDSTLSSNEKEPIGVASSSSTSTLSSSTTKTSSRSSTSWGSLVINRQKNLVKKTTTSTSTSTTPPTSTSTTPPPPSTTTTTNDSKLESTTQKTGLALLGSYDSDSNEESN